MHALNSGSYLWLSITDGRGGYSTEGCTMASSTDSDVECECSHLTSFTILLVGPGYLPLLQCMSSLPVFMALCRMFHHKRKRRNNLPWRSSLTSDSVSLSLLSSSPSPRTSFPGTVTCLILYIGNGSNLNLRSYIGSRTGPLHGLHWPSNPLRPAIVVSQAPDYLNFPLLLSGQIYMRLTSPIDRPARFHC